MASTANQMEVVPYEPSLHIKHVLTNWYEPDQRDKSGWVNGKEITHEVWLQNEVEAFRKRGRKAIIVKNIRGQLALVEMGRDAK